MSKPWNVTIEEASQLHVETLYFDTEEECLQFIESKPEVAGIEYSWGVDLRRTAD